MLGLFVALIIAMAFFTGFVLLFWFVGLAVALAAMVLLRDAWRRWRFVSSSRPDDPQVIDADYEDVSHKIRRD